MSESVAARHDLQHQPLVDPGASSGLMAVFEKRYLLRLMVRRDISARYAASMFGLAWSYINPLMRFLTFYLVFGLLMGRGGNLKFYAIHLYCGMAFVHYFTESMMSGTRSIINSRSVVQKMAMPRELFPISAMLVSLWHTIPQIAILAAACIMTGTFGSGNTWIPDPVGILAGVIALLICMFMGTGFGLMFACINVLFRDFARIIQTFVNLIPFSVPMMYPFWLVPQRFGTGMVHTLYMANPGVWVVLLVQRAFWYPLCAPKCQGAIAPGVVPNSFPPNLMLHGFFYLALSVLWVYLGHRVFARLQHRVPEML